MKQEVVVNTLLDKGFGVDILFLHLALLVLGENRHLHIRHIVKKDDILFVGKIGDVNIGMLGSLGLQNLGAEPDSIFDQDIAVINLVFAKIRKIAR